VEGVDHPAGIGVGGHDADVVDLLLLDQRGIPLHARRPVEKVDQRHVAPEQRAAVLAPVPEPVDERPADRPRCEQVVHLEIDVGRDAVDAVVQRPAVLDRQRLDAFGDAAHVVARGVAVEILLAVHHQRVADEHVGRVGPLNQRLPLEEQRVGQKRQQRIVGPTVRGEVVAVVERRDVVDIEFRLPIVGGVGGVLFLQVVAEGGDGVIVVALVAQVPGRRADVLRLVDEETVDAGLDLQAQMRELEVQHRRIVRRIVRAVVAPENRHVAAGVAGDEVGKLLVGGAVFVLEER